MLIRITQKPSVKNTIKKAESAQSTVRNAHLFVCVSLCTSVVHNTAWNSYDDLPSYLKMNIIVQMLSMGKSGIQYNSSSLL